MFPSFYAAKPLTPPPSPHHHLAHLCSTVLASLHSMPDEPRRQLRRRTRILLDQAALNPTVVLLALFYLRRASQLPTRGELTADEQILASLILAQKYHEDAAYTNKTWSELANVSVVKVNTIERALLLMLNHHLGCDPQEFARWTEQLGRWASQGSVNTVATPVAITPIVVSPTFHRRQISFEQQQICNCGGCQAMNYMLPWSPPNVMYPYAAVPSSVSNAYPMYPSMPMPPQLGFCWAMPSA